MFDIFPIPDEENGPYLDEEGEPFLFALSGGDGEGADGIEDEDDSDDADDSSAADTGQDGSDADDGDDAPKERTYPKAYVQRLKNEAKRTREERDAALSKIKAALSESDTDDEDEDEAVVLRTRLRNQALKHAVEREAANQNFADAGDAFALLDLSDVEIGDDLEPDSEEIAEALTNLAKSKPYLVKGKNDPGSGDGAPKGKPKTPDTRDDRVNARTKELKDRGMVEAPVLSR